MVEEYSPQTRLAVDKALGLGRFKKVDKSKQLSRSSARVAAKIFGAGVAGLTAAAGTAAIAAAQEPCAALVSLVDRKQGPVTLALTDERGTIVATTAAGKPVPLENLQPPLSATTLSELAVTYRAKCPKSQARNPETTPPETKPPVDFAEELKIAAIGVSVAIGAIGALATGAVVIGRRIAPDYEEFDAPLPYEAPRAGESSPEDLKRHADALQRNSDLQVLTWIRSGAGFLGTTEQDRAMDFLRHNCNPKTGELNPRVKRMISEYGGSLYSFIATHSEKITTILDETPVRLAEVDKRLTDQIKVVQQDLTGVHQDIGHLQKESLKTSGRLDRNNKIRQKSC